MSELLSQNDRLFTFQSPFPAEGTLVRSLEVEEFVSKLFRVRIQLISDDHGLDPESIIHQRVCVGIKHADGSSQRYFNGFVSEFRQDEPEERYAIYHAVVVPWFWFLTLDMDCRIYQEKTVPQVIQDVFDRNGFKDYDLSGLQQTHAQWEYCVQYRESSFDFVSRLMEMEGIYYWFKHEAGRHVLTLGDSSPYQNLPFKSEFRYERSEGSGVFHSEDSIFDWNPRKAVRAGKYTHDEFHFQKPKPRGKDLLRVTTETAKTAVVNKSYEVYDYPGEFEERGEGEGYGALRQEELEVDHHQIEACSNARAMTPGYKFTLTQHWQEAQNGAYFITYVNHSAHEGSVYGGDPHGGAKYENFFRCIPADIQYRPKRITPKHQMRGMQSAIVTGPGGEEIYCDSYGRVKVQFHWDRQGRYNENTTCWMRVMQPWAGANWGQVWIPRIGQEVVVAFFEGDPDRPFIVGGLYNEDSPAPYDLPANQTRMGVKTRSSKNGGPDNFNELRLEDKKGDELFLMHAERDMDVSVERNLHEKVEGERHEHVMGFHREKVDGDYSLKVQGARKTEVSAGESLDVGGDIHIKSGGKIVIEAATEIHLKAGMKVVIEGGLSASLIGSGQFVTATPAGVAIVGTLVNINSGGASGGPASSAQPTNPDDPELPDPMPRD